MTKLLTIADDGRRLISALLFFVATLVASQASAADQPRGVVELFTSQGCSSCPPADKILSQYANDGDVLALSWHVDYWNYLGWKDTFSKAEFTDRQQRYAVSFRRRGIYTPQAVINGRDHAVGSRKGDIENLMRTYANSGKGLTVPIVVNRKPNKVNVTTQASIGDATLYVVYFDKERTVKIKRGENSGATITYHNVVRGISMIGMLKDGKLDVTLALKELKRMGADSCALILQKTTPAGTPGAIVGAAIIDDLTS